MVDDVKFQNCLYVNLGVLGGRGEGREGGSIRFSLSHSASIR